MTTRYACTLQLPTHRISVNVYTDDLSSVEEFARLKAAKHMKRLEHRFVDQGWIVLLDQKQCESDPSYEPDTLFTAQHLVN